MICVNVSGNAQWPIVGVNTYVVTVLLTTDGLQVPVILFREVVDNVAVGLLPLQIAGNESNIGLIVG